MSVSRRLFALAGIAVLGALVSGCFDKEPEQRKAFVEFLQKRVIERPGLKIPIVKDEETKAMGPYAIHYGVMRRFHTALDESVSKGLMQAVQGGKVRSLQELMVRRTDLATLRSGIAKLRETLDKAEAEANEDRAKLQQSKDVADVYAVAFEKMVTRPARVMREIMPPLEGSLQAGQELGDYLYANQDKVSFRGANIEATDPGVRQRLSELLKTMSEKSSQIDAAQHQLRRLASGG